MAGGYRARTAWIAGAAGRIGCGGDVGGREEAFMTNR